MSHKPQGPAELRANEWARHLKPYGKRRVAKARRRDAQRFLRNEAPGRRWGADNAL